jgi:metal-responsive CopG/Arc/MetJ family transcriptional regulator
MRKPGRKITISVVLSPKLVEKMDSVLQREEYSGQSDLASIAITEHLLREEIKPYEEMCMKVCQGALENKEMIKLLDNLPRDRATQIEALKKKGMACIELREYEEAKDCFAKVRELEGKDSPNTQKVAEAKGCYKTLLSEEDESSGEETVEEQLRKDKVPKTATRRVVIE